MADSVLHHNKLQAILADSNDLLTKKIARSLCVLDNDTNYSRFSDDASAMHYQIYLKVCFRKKVDSSLLCDSP